MSPYMTTIALIIGAAILLSVFVNFQDPASWRGAVAGVVSGLTANGATLSPAAKRHAEQAPVESSTLSASCLEQKLPELRRAVIGDTKPESLSSYFHAQRAKLANPGQQRKCITRENLLLWI